MHATQVPRPFHTKGWVYEEKYDGWRMLAVKEAGGVRLVSRNGRDHTKRFDAIAEALAALKPKTFTLDGEVAVFDAEPISRFEWLRHINHGDLATPPLFMAFDLLQLGERDYRPQPLKVRRKALEKLLARQILILPTRRLMRNGLAAWAQVLTRGWEGYVAKDPESSYVAGRTLKWLKVKQPKYREVERGFYLRDPGAIIRPKGYASRTSEPCRLGWCDGQPHLQEAPQVDDTSPAGRAPSGSVGDDQEDGGRDARRAGK